MGEFPPRDCFGMTAEDRRWVRWESRRQHHRDRWAALQAIWGKPVLSSHPSQYVKNERGRGDDWTLWRAICTTIGVVFNRQWDDAICARYSARHGRAYGIDMAFWDARSVYGGYDVTVLWLYPSCRISIFSDGETML